MAREAEEQIAEKDETPQKDDAPRKEDLDEDEDETEEASPADEEAVGTDLEEFLQRKERRAQTRGEDPDEEEALLEAMEEREARGVETLTVKVIPEQPTEFTCQRCFLVKHRAQLKDRKRMYCNDCA